MIELSQDQRQELRQSRPEAIDPETRQRYILVRREVYDRLKAILEDDTQLTTADMLDRAMAENDANDPYLAELQKKYGGVR